MINIEALWTEELDSRVAGTISATGIEPINWRASGRKTAATPNKEDLEYWRTAGLEHVANWMAWLDANPDWKFASINGAVGIELPIEVTFGDVPVKGFIDAVMVSPDGELVVIDHKTGARAPEDHLQLGLYASALELMGAPRPSVGAYFLTRKGEMTEAFSLDAMTVEFFTNRFAQFKRGMDADIFLANPGQHCRSCSVKSSCYIAGGIDAWKVDPDSPNFNPNR